MENVNHPSHYNSGGIEVIDVIEQWKLGFHSGNALKYICRAGRKSKDPVEDLEKALWYIRRLAETVRITRPGYFKKALLHIRMALMRMGRKAVTIDSLDVAIAFILSPRLRTAVADIKMYAHDQDLYWLGSAEAAIKTEISFLRGEN